MSEYIIDNIDFHELEPMKYFAPPASWSDEKRRTETHNRIFSGDWIGARKMDGAFYQFNKSMDGKMELIGRSKGVGGDYLDKIEWVPQFRSFFEALPNGTCLLGEVVFPNNEGSKNTTTIMGCLKDKAIARQENGDKLHYYVFDCLAWDGNSLVNEPASTRFGKVKYLRNSGKYNFTYIDYPVYWSGVELWNYLQEILADGGEGIVIMHKDARYEPGKRPSKTTMKVKRELLDTIDCVVMGANPPTIQYTGKDIANWQYWWDNLNHKKMEIGEHFFDYDHGAAIVPVTKNYYYGWAGSWKIGLYKDGTCVHFGDLSGLTDEMKENWRDYVGKVVEVGGMQIFKDGDQRAIRHPKLLGFRSDKNPTECTWDQVE